MAKLVFFQILDGNFDQGFVVTMQIFDEHNRNLIANAKGRLPSPENLLNSYSEWRRCYRRIVLNPRIIIRNQPVTETEIITEINLSKNELYFHINEWLKPEGDFREIYKSLLTHLKDDAEDIRMIINTDDRELKQVPFFLWDFFNRYHRAEIGIALPIKSINIKNKNETVKVMAILADTLVENSRTQMQINKDLEILKDTLSLESNAEIIYLKSPDHNELANIIEKQKPQILFFAGHTDNNGEIALSRNESITIENLKFELIRAVDSGLKLAFFNSCNGVEIAIQLSEVGIPNIIVMREALPDKAAHLFLHHFLEEFVLGKPLNRAIRRAREKLNYCEKEFPGVMSLPMIWQTPAEPVLTWEILGGITRKQLSNLPVKILEKPSRELKSLIGSFLITSGILAVGYWFVINDLSQRSLNNPFPVKEQKNDR
jgi:CHAT domain